MKYIFCGSSLEKIASKIVLKPEDEFFHLPLSRSRKVDFELPLDQKYRAAVCASQNVVHHFPKGGRIRAEKWFAVGPKTAEVMKEKWNVERIQVPGIYNALSVAEMVLEQIQPSGLPVLWLGARGGVMSGVEKLISHGFRVLSYQPYESYPTKIQEFSYLWKEKQMSLEEFLEQKSIWLFTSPLTAKNYLDQKLNRPSHLLSCLGDTTASVLLNKGLAPYYVAGESTLDSMLDGLYSKLDHEPRGE